MLSVLWLTEWFTVLYVPHETQNGSFRWRSCRPISSLSTEESKHIRRKSRNTKTKWSNLKTEKTHKEPSLNKHTNAKPKFKPTLNYKNCSRVCTSLCTTVVRRYAWAQNSSDIFPLPCATLWIPKNTVVMESMHILFQIDQNLNIHSLHWYTCLHNQCVMCRWCCF